ncbi:MAG: hypothetical protein IPO21_08175 [Bacteroidales bacterium]|nr:hypothetical protein [Bacteroidales bacterium]
MVNFDESVLNVCDFLDSSEIISILVGQSGEDQLHCGIVYRFNGKFNAIHLAWHFYLAHEEGYVKNLTGYLFLKSSIHEIRQNSIAAMCRRILKRQDEQKIPYGLLYTGGNFTREGVLNLDTQESGLTCATFVMAVFKSCGIQLIDIENWEYRETDSVWHKSIVESLKDTKDRFGISELHIENVSNEQGCSRFRPEEVATSSVFKEIPADSKDIIRFGEELRNIVMKKKRNIHL